MARRLATELKLQRDQTKYLEDFKKNETFADILKNKVTENFAGARRKMDVLYNVT